MMQAVNVRQVNQMIRFVHLVLDKKFVGIQLTPSRKKA